MSRRTRNRKRASQNTSKEPSAKSNGKPKPSFELEALEPRILLSATWTGTDADDVFTGGNPGDEAHGLGGDDVLHGGRGNDLLFGDSGADQLFGDLGNDTLDGGAGDDILIGGGGNDVMDGGSGNDTFRFDGAQDGDTYTVMGGQGGQDTIDLSAYSDAQVQDNGSTLTVDMGGGQGFTVNYSDVTDIVTADGTYAPGSMPAPNAPPDAVADSVTTNEDAAVTTGNVLANDSDPDGDSLSVTGHTQGTAGTVTYNNDGTFTYTPNAGFSGSDSFDYTVDDGNGNTDTATVTVTVNAAQNAPAPVAQWSFNEASGTTAEDSVGNLDGTLTNMDGNEWSAGQHDNALTFDGVDDYVHSDTDLGQWLNGTSTLSAWINTTQVGVPQSYYSPSIIGSEQSDGSDDIRWGSIDDQGTIGISARNDTGARSDTAINDGQWHHVAFTRDAATGYVQVFVDGVLSGSATGSSGVLTSPIQDIGRTFDFNDGDPETAYFQGSLDEIQIYDSVLTADQIAQLASTNDAPTAVADAVTTNEDAAVTTGNVLANDSDPDGDTLSVTGNTQGANGSVVYNNDGTFTYTPNANFNGTDSFDYTVDDGNGNTDSATVTVTVNAGQDAPTAAADSVSTNEDTAVTTGNVLANDSDPDGDTLSVTGNTQGANGSVVYNNDGTFTYTPNADFSGTDSFDYTVDDGNGNTDTATVTVTVNPVESGGSGSSSPPPPPPPAAPSAPPAEAEVVSDEPAGETNNADSNDNDSTDVVEVPVDGPVSDGDVFDAPASTDNSLEGSDSTPDAGSESSGAGPQSDVLPDATTDSGYEWTPEDLDALEIMDAANDQDDQNDTDDVSLGDRSDAAAQNVADFAAVDVAAPSVRTPEADAEFAPFEEFELPTSLMPVENAELPGLEVPAGSTIVDAFDAVDVETDTLNDGAVPVVALDADEAPLRSPRVDADTTEYAGNVAAPLEGDVVAGSSSGEREGFGAGSWFAGLWGLVRGVGRRSSTETPSVRKR